MLFNVAAKITDQISLFQMIYSFQRVWFNVGTILVLVNVCIGAFLIVYITYIKKVSSDDWETHYPAAIPIANGSFIMGAVCVTVGLWPLWNILTPVILFILFMGMIVTLAMLPNF